MARGGNRSRSSGRSDEGVPGAFETIPLGRIGLILILAVVLLTVLVRVRLAATPLERDEGEYAYAGRLILEGEPPYKLAFNMKFPGTYYSYAVILATLGSTSTGIRLGLLLVNAATIALVYAVGRRLVGPAAAGVAAATYAVLTIDRWIMGIYAHATHFVLLAVLGGVFAMLLALERPRLRVFFVAGLLFGVGVMMKQHAAVFFPMAVAYVLWWTRSEAGAIGAAGWKRAAALTAGAGTPLALLVLVFALQGVLGAFWFWTFRYASAYVTTMPLSNALRSFGFGFGQIATKTAGLWVLAGAGLVLLWVGPWPQRARVLLSAFAVAAFAAICPGFYFRHHYFIVMLPAVSWLAGVAVVGVYGWLRLRAVPFAGVIAAATLVLAAAPYVVVEREYLFRMGPRQLCKERYGSNPFVEAEEISRYLREHTSPGERIAVLGSEPEIYFYSGRRSATGYIYMYPLMEEQPFASTMQTDMIRQIEEARPRYLVYANIQASWLPQPGSDKTVLRWADRLVQTCYDVVGIADIVAKNQTAYVWDAQAASYTPRSKYLVYVFRRKHDGPCPLPPY